MLIKDMHNGDTIVGIYLCKEKRSAETRNGKPYDDLSLQDKTGTVNGKIWDPNSPGIEEFDEKDFIEVHGRVNLYNNNLQLNIDQVRKASPEEYDPAEYVPASERNVDEMYQELMGYVQKITNPYLRQGVEYFFVHDQKFIATFCGHSAAKSLHHSFSGGLLEHTLNVTRLCDYLASSYDVLNRNLLLASAICHDIGKTKELSDFPDNDYTDEGQLVGHIVIGVEMLDQAIASIPDFPEVLANEWRHCILAHHGQMEYGSPKTPALAEALALHLADDIDAKMEMMKESLHEKEGEDWVGYNRQLESNLRHTSEPGKK